MMKMKKLENISAYWRHVTRPSVYSCTL